ncbi:hypothetical protein JYT83_01465 [bacterium AH-315-F18]|nr:hypothetical protein [bacterium AH-315-F18]
MESSMDAKKTMFSRRMVFLAIGLSMLLPVLFPFSIPSSHASPEVKRVYDRIDSLPAGSTMLLSFDFDPSSKPELAPMAEAVLTHALSRDVKVVCMGLWITGTSMAEELINTTVKRLETDKGMKKEYGTDYCFLGWTPGNQFVIQGMGLSISKMFPKDFYGKEVGSLPILSSINSLSGFVYVFSLTAGNPGLDQWVQFGSEFGITLGGGCTGVISPSLFPFLGTGQVDGLLGAMKGAAEYEKLLVDRRGAKPGTATSGMVAISITHFVLFFLILLGNLLDWRKRRA